MPAIKSPPSRRRGLKYKHGKIPGATEDVASLAEAWIEIRFARNQDESTFVASLAEAWIEIQQKLSRAAARVVASLAEAWIEIRALYGWVCTWQGRLPRGGVD